MSSDAVIEVQALSKRYEIYAQPRKLAVGLAVHLWHRGKRHAPAQSCCAQPLRRAHAHMPRTKLKRLPLCGIDAHPDCNVAHL